MRANDISNRIAPTIMVVWEGVIAPMPQNAVPARRRLKIRSSRPVSIDPIVEAALWRVELATDLNIEVVTFLGEEEAERIEQMLVQRNFPARRVRAFESPEELARHLIWEPWVQVVYDGDPRRQFTYGHQTRIVTSENRDRIGAF